MVLTRVLAEARRPKAFLSPRRDSFLCDWGRLANRPPQLPGYCSTTLSVGSRYPVVQLNPTPLAGEITYW